MNEKRQDYLTWDEYFMGLAILSSERSKDPSTQTGACIVNDDNKIISIGYNGLTNGMDDDNFTWASKGELTGNLFTTKNPWVVHAEVNAILNSHLDDLKNATMYVTLFPCNECAKVIIQSGIKKIIYLRMYKYEEIVNITKYMFEKANITYEKFNIQEYTKDIVQNEASKIKKIIKKLKGGDNYDEC